MISNVRVQLTTSYVAVATHGSSISGWEPLQRSRLGRVEAAAAHIQPAWYNGPTAAARRFAVESEANGEPSSRHWRVSANHTHRSFDLLLPIGVVCGCCWYMQCVLVVFLVACSSVSKLLVHRTSLTHSQTTAPQHTPFHLFLVFTNIISHYTHLYLRAGTQSVCPPPIQLVAS